MTIFGYILIMLKRFDIKDVGEQKTHLLCSKHASESMSFATKFKVT